MDNMKGIDGLSMILGWISPSIVSDLPTWNVDNHVLRCFVGSSPIQHIITGTFSHTGRPNCPNHS